MRQYLRRWPQVVPALAALMLMFAVSLLAPGQQTAFSPSARDPAFYADRILMEFTDEDARLAFRDRTGLSDEAFTYLPSIGFYIVELQDRWDATTALSQWTGEPGVASVMRDFLPVPAAAAVPDQIKDQWGFQRTYIQEAQAKVTSTSQVKVGLIDSPVSTTNPFLADRLIQPRIYADVNQDDTAHGTAVASLIAAIAPRNAMLYSYGIVIDDNPTDAIGGETQTSNIFTALQDADADDVKILNMSMEYCNEYYLKYPDFRIFSEQLHHELLDLTTSGMIIIAPAGNGTQSACTDAKISFPAVWNDVTIAIGGAALTGTEIRPTSWSSKGYAMDLIAPVENIKTYYPTTIQNLAGTSFATPFVSGTVALMLAVNPSLSGSEIRDILAGTAKHLNGYSIAEQGWGFLDAASAVQAATNPTRPTRPSPLAIDVSGINSMDYTVWPTLELTNANNTIPTAATSYISYINTSELAHYQIPEISTRGKKELYVYRDLDAGRSYCSITAVSSSDGDTQPAVASAFEISDAGGISHITAVHGTDFNVFTTLTLEVSCTGAPPIQPPEPPAYSPSVVPVEIVYAAGAQDLVDRIRALISTANQKMTSAGIDRILQVKETSLEFSSTMVRQNDGSSCLIHGSDAVRIYAGVDIRACPMETAPDYPAIVVRTAACPATDSEQYRSAANIFARQIAIALGGRHLTQLATALTGTELYDPNTPSLMYSPAFSTFSPDDASLINANTNVPDTNYMLWQTLIPSAEQASLIQVSFYDLAQAPIAGYTMETYGRVSDRLLSTFSPAFTYAMDSSQMETVTLLDILPELSSGSGLWSDANGIMKNEVLRYDVGHNGVTDTYYFDSADLGRLYFKIKELDASGTYSGLRLNFYSSGNVAMDLVALDYISVERPPVSCGELPTECNPQQTGNHPPSVERWYFDGQTGPVGTTPSDIWGGTNDAPTIRSGESKTFIVYYENNDGVAPGDPGQEIQASATVSAGALNENCNGPAGDDQAWALTYDSTGVQPGTLVTITVEVTEPNACSNRTGSGTHTFLVE